MGRELYITQDSLREIGWTLWDPIGLFEEDWREQEFADEYDLYIIEALRRLLAAESDEQIAAYLVTVETEEMSLKKTEETQARALRVAQALRDLMGAAAAH